MHVRGAALFLALVAVGSPAHAEFEQQLGPLAGAVRTQLLQGWTAGVEDGWFTLRNKATAGSEQTLYLNVGQAPEGGRITDVNVVLNSKNPKASIGLALTNRARKGLCLLELTAAKQTILFCLDGDKRRDIANVPNVAKLDGSDRIKVVEVPGAARFIVNGQKIGDIENEPALGSELGIMAYEVGTFGIADFTINSNVNANPGQGGGQPAKGGGGQQAPTRAPQAAPDSGASSGLAGSGPYPRFGGDSLRIVAVYIGIMRSIFMHEFGHALIGELELPSTGAEEDAVDIYSALQIVEPTMYPSSDKDTNAMAQGAAKYAALQWYYSGKLAEAQGAGNSPWQDEHTGDLKRFRNMLCIMYGGNPGVFESLVEQVGFEDRTKARCADEFTKQNRAWRRILAPHTRIGAWSPDGQQPANAPGAPVNVTFEPSSRRIGNLFANNLSEAIANNIKLLGQTYVLPRPVNVVFKDCGKLNAWYSPREGSITMCYELIENVAVMISDIEMGTVGGEPKQGGAAPRQAPQQAPQPPQRQQPPAGQPQRAPGNGGFDELQDAGVPPTTLLFSAPYKGPTPNTHPRAKVVTTKDVVALLTDEKNKNFLVIDTSGLRETIPGAFPLSDAGSDGSVTDQMQEAFDGWLHKKTGTEKEHNVPLIIVGAGMNDRSSYNAALRAGMMGWPVYWYRGGMEAWVANGLPTNAVKSQGQ